MDFEPVWPSDAIWWQRTEPTLVQVMVACMRAPIYYLNQSWLIISMGKFHPSAGNSTKDTTAINHWKYLENQLPTTTFKSSGVGAVFTFIPNKPPGILVVSINLYCMRRYHCQLCYLSVWFGVAIFIVVRINIILLVILNWYMLLIHSCRDKMAAILHTDIIFDVNLCILMFHRSLSNQRYSNIGSDNDLAPSRRKVLTNGGLIYGCLYI